MELELLPFLPNEISDFIFQTYNKQVCILQLFESYEDKVILLQDVLTDCDPNLKGEKYILKIFLVKKDSKILEKRVLIVSYLNKQGFTCSSYLKGKDGMYAQFLDKDSSSYLCVLYLYLPGVELENAVDLRNSSIIFELGAYLGYLHKSLENVAVDNLNPNPDDPWLLCNFTLLKEDDHLDYIKSSNLKKQVQKVINDAEKKFKVNETFLKKGIIHGDFHSLNLIVNENFSKFEMEECDFLDNVHLVDGSSDKVEGIKLLVKCLNVNHPGFSNLRKNVLVKYSLIDFGETVYTYRILEVGRLVADIMVTILMTHYFSPCFFDNIEDILVGLKDCESLLDYTYQKNPNLEHKLCITIAKNYATADSKKYVSLNECLTDLCRVGGVILKGYYISNYLYENELAVLKETIMISLVQYFGLSLQTSERHKEKAEHAFRCRQAAAIIFLKLSETAPDELFGLWSNANLLPAQLGKP